MNCDTMGVLREGGSHFSYLAFTSMAIYLQVKQALCCPKAAFGGHELLFQAAIVAVFAFSCKPLVFLGLEL